MKPFTIALVFAASFAGGAHAQTAYKCGNTYSQVPCGPDAKTTNIAAAAGPESFDQFDQRLKQKVADPMPGPATVAASTKACEQATRASLHDPDAAKISGVTRFGAHNFLLGGKLVPVVSYNLVVNGKNGYGGYTGEKPFACYFTLDESTLIQTKAL